VPYQEFQTLDGAMLLAVGNDGQFARFCQVAGQPKWALDARFASNTLRVQNRELLIPLLQALTQTRRTAEWIALLEDKAVPCGAINDIGQAFADAQVKARGLVLNQPLDPVNTAQAATKTVSNVNTVASPLRLTATPPVLRRAPPTLGQHSDEVLAELGLDAAQVTALRQAGVV
jgi:formyl-CoA transferase